MVEYVSTDQVTETKTAKYINEGRLFFCPNPKTTQSGNFTIQNSAPPSLISEEKQITNVGYCKSKFLAKNVDVDFTNHKGINCAAPSNSNDVVNKTYCDSNSKNNSDGTGVITGILGGILGGAVSNILISSIGTGLAGVGSITGSLAAGTGALATGILIGGSSDFDRIASNGQSQQLIDNVKSDIANSNPAEQGAALVRGAMSVSGFFRAPANSALGLFDV